MKRLIRTDYYQGKDIVKSNYAVWAPSAVTRAVGHMQLGQYDASHCEVYDMANGQLHAVLRMPKGGRELVIVFKRDPSGVAV